ALDVGERTPEMAQRPVHQVVQVLAPGGVPLFLADGFKDYAAALLTQYGHWVPPSRQTVKGPIPRPRWMPLPERCCAQVGTRDRPRRLLGVSHREAFGTLAGVKQALASQGWHIHTVCVEGVHLTIRHHVAAVGRRVMTRCKNAEGLRHRRHLYQTSD